MSRRKMTIAHKLFAAMTASFLVALGVAMSGNSAHASYCSPWPTCFGTAYQVTGTPDNSLDEWSNSPLLGGTIVRSVPNGSTL